VLCAVLLLAFIVPVQAMAGDTSAVVRSLLFPGSGQAHQGHYTKATVFAGAAIISGVGLIVSQIQYSQSVDRFNEANSEYTSLATEWSNGEIVSIVPLEGSYQAMTDASSDADSRLKWRNFFLVTLTATYTLNLIDVLISKPYDPEQAMRYQVEATPRSVMVTRSFRF